MRGAKRLERRERGERGSTGKERGERGSTGKERGEAPTEERRAFYSQFESADACS